ncbi:MAG: zf-HC2 domain-containing protein [Acidobacteriota bacterium]
MNCADLEALICDYVDGTLRAPERELVERHLAACAACRELAGDCAAAVGFIERAAAVEPPPELVTRILFQIPTRHHTRAQRLAGVSRWLGRLAHPIFQPRFAMGMAMTILSFSMLGKFAGITPRQLSPADLHPAKVWQAMDDRLHRAWERAGKFYQSLKVVYEIQSQLREWTAQEEEDRGVPSGPAGAEPGGPAGGEAGQRPASPGAEQAPGKSR